MTNPWCVCQQITDDSEMAMCLLQGLLESDASGPLPLDAIASWYICWLHSPPFDIGGHPGCEVAFKWLTSGRIRTHYMVRYHDGHHGRDCLTGCHQVPSACSAELAVAEAEATQHPMASYGNLCKFSWLHKQCATMLPSYDH